MIITIIIIKKITVYCLSNRAKFNFIQPYADIKYIWEFDPVYGIKFINNKNEIKRMLRESLYVLYGDTPSTCMYVCELVSKILYI